jgi:hypothetical protein
MRICLQLFLLIFISCQTASSQIYHEADITFDFNDQNFKEKNDKIKAKAASLTFVEDRFGNSKSAIYIHGNISSYLNLGTSPLLKPQRATISLWVNLDREVRTGKGYSFNPIICTKNSTNHGWYNSYHIGLELSNYHICCVNSLDSTKPEALVHSTEPVQFNKWYHYVMTFDHDTMALYINGELESKCPKKFETIYLASDSVVVGHSASSTNVRFSMGKFDDIQIFHRVLGPDEVKELYNAPNPNKYKRILSELIKYTGLALIPVGIGLILLYRYRRKMKQQEERLELQKHIAELEMKVIKTQMNPHFISNCLAAIQELIYSGNVDKAGQYIAKFSLFLRGVLDHSDKTYISLKEEMQIIKLNIELEQLRFKETIRFSVEVSGDVDLQTPVPSLITQPLIENAIWHGLLPLKDLREPRLKLKVYSINGSVLMEIQDNGVGRKTSNPTSGKVSRGTKLVKDKLESISKLTSSKNYNLKIEDLVNDKGEPEGTKIILQLDKDPETI